MSNAADREASMFEVVPAEFSIGGKIRAELVPVLGNPIADKVESLERSNAYFRPQTAEQLSAARQDHDGPRQPWHCDQRANFWRSYMLEEFLEREQFASDDDGGPPHFLHDHDVDGPSRRLGGQHGQAANVSRTAAVFRDGATQPAIEKLSERNRHARFTQKILPRNKPAHESNSKYSAALTVRP